MILTSTTAGLYFNNVRVGKVKNIDLDISREAMRTTTIDLFDNTYIAGLRDTKASALLFYDPQDPTVVNILDTIYADTPEILPNFKFVWDINTNRSLTSDAVITNIGLSATYGEAQVCKLSVQLSGKPTAKSF
jgi:hypothetical protein